MDGSAAFVAAYATTSPTGRASRASISVFPSGSSHRTPSVTCAPPPAQGETRRTTGARSAASRLSATHAPTDTSAFKRADASASGPVPSMAAAGSLRPSAASSPCRAAVSPMGHVRKRLPMALAILLAAMLSLIFYQRVQLLEFQMEI